MNNKIRKSHDVLGDSTKYETWDEKQDRLNKWRYNSDHSIKITPDFELLKKNERLAIYSHKSTSGELIKRIRALSFLNKSYSDKNGIIYSDLGKIEIFISKDGVELINRYQSWDVGLYDIALFVEEYDGDIFSDSILLIKAGEKIKDKLKSEELKISGKLFNDIYDIAFINELKNKKEYVVDRNQYNILIASLNDVEGIFKGLLNLSNKAVKSINQTVAGSISDSLNLVLKFIDSTIRISEEEWISEDNTDSDILNKLLDTIAKGFDLFISKLIELKDIVAKYLDASMLTDFLFKIKEMVVFFKNKYLDYKQFIRISYDFLVGFFCGIWNGFIDLIKSFLELFKLILDGIHKATDENTFALYLEYMDNFLQVVLNVEWLNVLENSFNKIKDVFFNTIDSIKKVIIEGFDINLRSIGYKIGYLLFNIFEFFVPITKAAKLAKTKSFTAVAEEFVSSFKDFTRQVKAVGQASKQIKNNLFQILDLFIKIMRGGTKEINKIIDIFIEKLLNWGDEIYELLIKIYSDKVSDFMGKIQSFYNVGKKQSKLEKKLHEKYYKEFFEAEFIKFDCPV